jgi:predicted nucleotidyltransferase
MGSSFFSGKVQKNMRLTEYQIQTIRQLACQVAGSKSRVRVFGSRLDDSAHGGDVDLMLELPEPVDNPALMAAQMSALVSRAMHGRKVDVLLSAPNLMRLPIHDMAFKEGQLL